MIFTICSNNYLGQALSLGSSITQQAKDYQYEIFLVGKPDNEINYEELDYKITFIDETIVPGMADIIERFNIIELNTAVKPFVFQFIFDKYTEVKDLFYLDPDTFFFSHPQFLSKTLENYNFSITPHVNTPIPIDGKQPQEELFLNYGIYNLGYIGVKRSKDGDAFLKWWAERTFKKGIIKLEEGLFVDQLWINYLPVFWENVNVVKDPGYNMGPWNLHERTLQLIDNNFFVNQSFQLVFYHFSNYNPANSGHIVKGENYNRYDLSNRPDLVEIYKIYQDTIVRNNYTKYINLKKTFSELYEKKQKKLKWQRYKKKPSNFFIDFVKKMDKS